MNPASTTSIARRQVLIGLAGASLFVASGCAALRSGTDLDSALEELDALLGSIEGDPNDELAVIAGKIGEQSRGLIDAHDAFDSEFTKLAMDRDVSDETLGQLVVDYDTNRRELRNELLRSQDELLELVPNEALPDVLEVLNRKQLARVPNRAREV